MSAAVFGHALAVRFDPLAESIKEERLPVVVADVGRIAVDLVKSGQGVSVGEHSFHFAADVAPVVLHAANPAKGRKIQKRRCRHQRRALDDFRHRMKDGHRDVVHFFTKGLGGFLCGSGAGRVVLRELVVGIHAIPRGVHEKRDPPAWGCKPSCAFTDGGSIAKRRRAGQRAPAKQADIYGFPTNVVTDWAGSEPENRPAAPVIGVPASRLEEADVTYGVTVAGQPAPETKNETCWALEPSLSATMATVPSVGLTNGTM